MAKPQKGKGFAVSGHKRLSASNAKRYMNCHGAIALIESLPLHEQISGDSVHSRRGTCAHAVGEMCLVAYHKNRDTPVTPDDYLGMEVEKVLVDQEIVNGAQAYVDWARPLIDAADMVSIEESLDLYDFITQIQGETGEFISVNGHELGGTGDLITGQLFGTLDVADYKNGKGIVVEVVDNPQLLIYALSALAKYLEEYDFSDVRMTIVQPNGRHEEGTIRSWTVSVEFVLNWATEELLPAAERCMDAVKALKRGDPDFVTEYLRADDDWCTFCPARARCPAALNQAVDSAAIEFQEALGEFVDDDFGTELILHVPNVALITAEQESLLLKNGDAIIGFIQAIQQRAHIRAENGERVEGFKLVHKSAHRRYKSAETAVKDDLKRMGLHAHDYMDNPTLKSPAKLEQAFKAKGVDKEKIQAFISKHVERPEIGTVLVHESDKRPAAKPAIEAEFEHLFEADDLLSL